MTRDKIISQFISSLKIRTRDLQLKDLCLNTPQKMIFDKYADSLARRKKLWAIILKARREGVSTLTEALMTFRAFEEDMVHAKVIAHITESTRTIWEMAKLMVNESPALAKLSSIVGQTILFGKSRLTVATAGSPDATRSEDLTCVHLSEVAFWPKPEAMLAVMQCVPEHFESWVFVESTANGKTGEGALFYEEWQRAQAGDSDFLPIFLPWFVMPEYRIPGGKVHDDPDHRDEEQMLISEFGVSEEQLAWRRWAIRNKCQGDVNKFHQEYPSSANEAFVASGLPFFTTAQLAPFEKMLEKGQKYRIDEALRHDANGYLEVFRRPEPGHDYVIGADSSFGIDDEANPGAGSHSRSAFQVLDMETMEQVAEYDCASPPHVMAKHLAKVGRYSDGARLCPEVQASGGGGGRELIVYLRQDHNYFRIYQYKHSDRIKGEKPVLLGWETNAKTRPRMIARLREVIEEKSCIIHSAKLLEQLANFGENETGRLESLQGHDDLLFAFGIALVSRSENFVAKKFKYEPEPDYELSGMGIKTVQDTSRLLSDHYNMIMSGRRRANHKKDYLEY